VVELVEGEAALATVVFLGALFEQILGAFVGAPAAAGVGA
jgi:hypothetical protein